MLFYIHISIVFVFGFIFGYFYKPLKNNLDEINFNYIKNYILSEIFSKDCEVEITNHGHARLNKRMGVPVEHHEKVARSFITEGKDLEELENPKINQIIKHNNGDKIFRKNKHVGIFGVNNYNEYRLITVIEQSYIRDLMDRMNRYDIENNPDKAKEIIESGFGEG